MRTFGRARSRRLNKVESYLIPLEHLQRIGFRFNRRDCILLSAINITPVYDTPFAMRTEVCLLRPQVV